MSPVCLAEHVNPDSGKAQSPWLPLFTPQCPPSSCCCSVRGHNLSCGPARVEAGQGRARLPLGARSPWGPQEAPPGLECCTRMRAATVLLSASGQKSRPVPGPWQEHCPLSPLTRASHTWLRALPAVPGPTGGLSDPTTIPGESALPSLWLKGVPLEF